MKKSVLKRVLAAVLVAAMLVAAIPMSASAADATWSNPYGDVKKSDWYYNAVKFMNYYNFISGTSDTTFSPNTTTSRAMFVTILGRIVNADVDAYKGTSRFADVKAGNWAEPSIAWAAANGIVNGVGDNKFNPDGAVTREQSATILYNFLNSTGYDVSGAGNALTSFTDTATISNYARNAMNWIVAAGIIAGDGTGTIKPKSNAPRSQIAQILMKFANHKAALDGKVALTMPEDASIPAPVEEIPDTGVVEGYESGAHVQYLPNGKPATTLNVQEILFGLQAEYPDGSDYQGNCAKYANMCGRAIAGDAMDGIWYEVENPKFSDVRVGDAISLKGGTYSIGWISSGNHVVIALKVYKDHIVFTDGNVNGKVRWGGVLYDYDFNKGCYLLTTQWRYPDIVRELESETYQIANNYQPVDVHSSALKNGNPITSENIKAALAGVMAQYPEGAVCTEDTPIHISYYNTSGAGGFQRLCALTLFDETFAHTIKQADSSYAKIKIGDGLNVRGNDGSWRYYFVLDKTSTSLLTATASHGGIVSWNYVLEKQALDTSSYAINSYYYGDGESIS